MTGKPFGKNADTESAAQAESGMVAQPYRTPPLSASNPRRKPALKAIMRYRAAAFGWCGSASERSAHVSAGGRFVMSGRRHA